MTELPLAVDTVDYHTGGEPFRIIVGGVPPLQGSTILERRRFALEQLDHVRRLLVYEPRGHADMYGCHVVPPDDAGADLGVVFFHNEGYSTACGHGTIALVTWALETGTLPMTGPETPVTVDVPSGRLACVARCDVGARRVTSVRFTNVPSFVLATGVTLPTSRGPVTVDVSYGGAFYGSADVRALGLAVDRASLPVLIDLQRELRPALDAALDIVHPDEPELRGIYGIIWWQDEPAAPGDDAAPHPAQRHRLRRRRGRPLAVRQRHVRPPRPPPRRRPDPDRGDAPPPEHRRLRLRGPRHRGHGSCRAPRRDHRGRGNRPPRRPLASRAGPGRPAGDGVPAALRNARRWRPSRHGGRPAPTFALPRRAAAWDDRRRPRRRARRRASQRSHGVAAVVGGRIVNGEVAA